MNTSSWRWFPVWLIAAMVGVAIVNGYMVYAAVKSFPGPVGMDGIDLRNDYNRVLDVESVQAALGWRVETSIDAQRRPLLMVVDREGQPLPAARIDVEAERPVGPKDHTVLALRDLGQGRLQSDTTLFSGQWDLLVTVHSGDHVYSTTRRVMVR
ncbi:MAG: FixH family protein [Acetobacteraceae bacterium]|nr:FixH family protein [Pseudomonadota bacterium]